MATSLELSKYLSSVLEKSEWIEGRISNAVADTLRSVARGPHKNYLWRELERLAKQKVKARERKAKVKSSPSAMQLEEARKKTERGPVPSRQKVADSFVITGAMRHDARQHDMFLSKTLPERDR